MNPKPLNLFELTHAELTESLKNRCGKGEFHATAIYREVYKNGNLDLQGVKALSTSTPIRDFVAKDLRVNLYPVVDRITETGLVKFVTRLPDEHEIESVVIPMFNRHTICVSSQVGCRMGCTICETAQMGFVRNLTAEEIVGQVYTARYRLDAPIRNIVFMGMGEPLDNFANVVQAIRILSDPRGFDIARRYITVSTIGNIEGIQKLADLDWPTLKLAISLNAPNDTLRSRILPTNRRWPMAKLKETLVKYPLKHSSAIMIEYVLIKDVNDSREHARELAEFLRPLNVKINLIPYNTRLDSPYTSPRDEDVERFCGYLIQEKMFVRKRLAKGRDILAACGQLGARANHSNGDATAASQLRQ